MVADRNVVHAEQSGMARADLEAACSFVENGLT